MPLRIVIDTHKDKAPIVLKSSNYKVKLTKSLLEEIEKQDILSLKIRPEDQRFRKVPSYSKIDETELFSMDQIDE